MPHGSPVLGRAPALLLAAALVTALFAGCGSSSKKASGGSRTATPAGSMNALAKGRTQYSLVQAEESLPVGKSRFVFGLIPQGGKPKVGGSPLVYVAKKATDKPRGPFHATWR